MLFSSTCSVNQSFSDFLFYYPLFMPSHNISSLLASVSSLIFFPSSPLLSPTLFFLLLSTQLSLLFIHLLPSSIIPPVSFLSFYSCSIPSCPSSPYLLPFYLYSIFFSPSLPSYLLPAFSATHVHSPHPLLPPSPLSSPLPFAFH